MYKSLFLFALLVQLSTTSQSLSSTWYMDCSLTTIACGAYKLNISYPFRKPGMPAYCGRPEFEVSCTEDHSKMIVPMIGIAEKEYYVQSINYNSQFIAVSDIGYSADTCPVSITNITFDPSLFNYSTNCINLTVYFNCSLMVTVPANLMNIPCPENNSTGYSSYIAVPGGDSRPRFQPEVPEKCNSIVAIRMYTNNVHPLVKGRMDFLGVLQDGFGLQWIVGKEWCGRCEVSGGVCGFDSNSTDAQICFCPDGRTANGTCTQEEEKKAEKAEEEKREEEEKRKNIAIIGASVGGAVAAALIACVFFFWCKRRKRLQRSGLSNLLTQSTSSKFSSVNDPELAESNYHTHIFSYEELQEATNGFDPSGELGDGGFGTVYKGKLRDGRTVAVKRLYEHNYKRLEQFMNEVAILSRLRHQHLVTLYGCTSRRSRELLLVYEFVANGTIADHLHGTHTSSGPLLWHDRMSIAIETADALAYLHAVEPPIIHRDVKSTNILLDNNFHVKVADFGLSRLFPLDATHVSTAPQGTPGYVDPEYHQCYQLTDKSDVYSFGVVLVELISSKPAVDISRSRHEINLANMAVNMIQRCQLEQLVDPALGYDSDLEVKRMITQVAELAFTCLQSDGDLRPSIKEVLEELIGIKNGTGSDVFAAGELVVVETKEETRALKDASLFSPDSVAERWQSTSTTSGNSG